MEAQGRPDIIIPNSLGLALCLKQAFLRSARVKEAVLLQGKSDFIKSSTSQKLELLVVYWKVEENMYVQ